ncbi:MAG: fused MFS/spermidine synthase [bacterium]|nr:fused MFS/spermidine synthase [bacterium]
MRFIKTVAFISGLVVLGIEITAFRIVAPFFGNSIFITTNILAVILAGLALGYWLGGVWADKLKTARPLFLLMLVTACLCALIPFVAPALLGLLRDQITTIDWRLVVFSLIGVAALFFIPFVLLGTVSPWLVRLATQQHDQRGRGAGNVFAWSTLGSLLGTFLPTLLLVPLLGTKKTILLLAALLALIAAVGLGRWKGSLVALIILTASLVINPALADDPSVVAERESALEYLRVVSDGGSAVHLEQDEGLGVHSVYDPDKLATGLVFDWLSFTPELTSAWREQQRLDVAVIGLAAGTVARQLDRYYAGESLSITGVELDPETIKLGREFFGLDDIGSLTAIVGDGRTWLSTQQDRFDVIIVDAFRQLYIPAHMSTIEFFEQVRGTLKDGGVMALNLNTVSEDSHVARSFRTTIASVFPYTYVVDIPGSYNTVFYASDSPISTPQAELFTNTDRHLVANSLEDSLQQVQPDQDLAPATDDRPLVESWYDLMIGQSFLGG